MMSEEDAVKLETLNELLEDIKSIHPEYIEEYIKEQISILMEGI